MSQINAVLGDAVDAKGRKRPKSASATTSEAKGQAAPADDQPRKRGKAQESKEPKEKRSKRKKEVQ